MPQCGAAPRPTELRRNACPQAGAYARAAQEHEDQSLTPADHASDRDRLSTGVPELDTLLRGGLKPGSVCILQGYPGSGKTILANQICFHRAAQNETCLYTTVLAESHDRLIGHLQALSFFAPDRIATNISYESAFSTLEKDGLDGILKLLTRERQTRSARVVVLDGLFLLEDRLSSEAEFRRFVNGLSVFANLTGALVLLLTNSKRSAHTPEYTMVDTWIELGTEQLDHRAFRFLQVHKFRGSDFISGRHAVTISAEGLRVLPRLESVASQQATPLPPRDRLTTGVREFDAMVGGGLRKGSNTVLSGPTGIGKTNLGLHFISASSATEPGLIFTLYESPEELLDRASLLGLDLQRRVDEGWVEVMWHPAAENQLDAVGYRLLQAVERRGVRRLFLDGLDQVYQSSGRPARFGQFLSALTNTLRGLGVTSLLSHEPRGLLSSASETPLGVLSAAGENLIRLRFVEQAHELSRELSIVKIRNSDFDHRFRQFRITDQGFCIDAR
jgi:circadian clock protein KaiC